MQILTRSYSSIQAPLSGTAEAGSFVFLEVRSLGITSGASGYRLTIYSCILLNPEFAGSPVLKEFLFS
jgi:hypothetical protein